MAERSRPQVMTPKAWEALSAEGRSGKEGRWLSSGAARESAWSRERPQVISRRRRVGVVGRREARSDDCGSPAKEALRLAAERVGDMAGVVERLAEGRALGICG